MTAAIGSLVTGKVITRLTAPTGVNANISAITTGSPTPVALLNANQIIAGNIAPDLAERSSTAQYPTAMVYCEKITNSLVEKFRTFSGTMQMVIELRHSQDRLDGLQAGLEVYSDAVMQMLDASRGDWSNGTYYAGGYQVSFGPVKHGGKNFLQAAKISFEIGVSIS